MFEPDLFKTCSYRDGAKQLRRRYVNPLIRRLITEYECARSTRREDVIQRLEVPFHPAEVFCDYRGVEACEPMSFTLYTSS